MKALEAFKCIQVGGVHDGAIAAAKHQAAHGRELLQPLGLATVSGSIQTKCRNDARIEGMN